VAATALRSATRRWSGARIQRVVQAAALLMPVSTPALPRTVPFCKELGGPTADRLGQQVSYDPTWPGLFAELGRELRGGLGDVALRIDHIGSTSVPGLAAKPVIDIQVSVASFEPIEAFKQPVERLGYGYRADNPARTKRYFREPTSSGPAAATTRSHAARPAG